MASAFESREPPLRTAFRAFRAISTRWMDNDQHGHVNNVTYYSWFDTAVNGYLMEATGTDTRHLPAIGVVVENGCRYFTPLSFPEPVEIGLAVERLGNRSISYRLGVFAAASDVAAAAGRFVHVYVDATTRKPVEIPDVIRTVAARLLIADGRSQAGA
jgi:acyl-CoA thioester hydrolase